MKRLLLISSSRVWGSGYLEHCAEEIRARLGGCERVLFVPYALADHEGYTATVAARFGELGYAVDGLHRFEDPVAAVERAEALFIGGGNTFRLLERLYRHDLLAPIRARVAAGMPYIGSSAGSNVATLSIRTTNDMPIVEPPSFTALGLVPFNLNPHYLDPEPGSKHMGETREDRIRQFHEENEPPVVGLREGGLLWIEGDSVELRGVAGARIFRRGQEPVEVQPPTRLEGVLGGVRKSS